MQVTALLRRERAPERETLFHSVPYCRTAFATHLNQRIFARSVLLTSKRVICSSRQIIASRIIGIFAASYNSGREFPE